MTITVPGMRYNKLVSMDIDQLRVWATFMDRAMIVSLIATIMAVTALGITTWLSFRFSGALRAHEHAVIDRYKGMESHSVQLEQDVAAAREPGRQREGADAAVRCGGDPAATCRSGEARQGGNHARGKSDPGERDRNATPDPGGGH